MEIPNTISESIQLLSQQIASELDRIAKEPQNEMNPTDSLVYIGNWQDAIPRSIWVDQDLDPIDVRSWGVIRTQAIHRSAVMLSLNKLLKEKLDYSSATLSRVIFILRLTRWISLCSQLRTEQGRFRGNIYAIHDTPITLSDSIYLDEEYLSFVEKHTAHKNEKIRQLAKSIWQSLDESIKTDFGFFQHSNLPETVSDSLQIMKENNRVHILNMDENGPKNHVYNLNVDEKHHVHILNMVGQKYEDEENQQLDIHVQNLNTVPICSSSSGSSGSSNFFNNKFKEKTTTTNSVGISKAENKKNLENLIYPKEFNKNEIKLAKIWLEKIESVLQQDFLDETAAQIIHRRKTAKPIFNPTGWLSWLINEHCQGNTCLTSMYLKHQEKREREQRTEKANKEKEKELTKAARQGVLIKNNQEVEELPFTEEEKTQNKEKRWGKLSTSLRKRS